MHDEQFIVTDDMIRDLIHNEERLWLYQHIMLLKGVKKEIMILSLYSYLKDDEIAEYLQLSINNVRTCKHRAKTELIKMNQEENKNG